MNRLFALGLLLAVGVVPLRAGAADAPKELRIGYQKSSELQILKDQSLLEKRFAAQGTAVKWVEFQSGPPLLEALNAGAIDFGATGDTPPIFAQAAGSTLVYVASYSIPGQSNAILVRDDARIKSLGDLRGKRVAFTRGSSANNVIVRALGKAGLTLNDVQIANLQPADAAAAIRSGSIDAWAIWDPFYGVGERLPGVHVLTNAVGIAPSNSFYLAGRDYANRYPATLTTVIDELNHAADWARTHPQELVAALSAQSGVPVEIERVVVARGPYTLRTVPITPAVLKQQQSIADLFAKLALIPRAVDVKVAIWTPGGKALAGER
jgi:aliphatic sulfonates family ABC transporter substrate-binding protein